MLESQRIELSEQFEDDGKLIEMETNTVESISNSDWYDEKLDINDIPTAGNQFDILWDTLSGQENFTFLPAPKVYPLLLSDQHVAQKLLAELILTDVAKTRSSNYSGRMRRRLSVAIALIGEPKLVILDEPVDDWDESNDLETRSDVIQEAKKRCCIVLTTHSMEEAGILSNRIGMMANGKLLCIGISISLKSRFRTGFVANIRFSGNTDSTLNGGTHLALLDVKP